MVVILFIVSFLALLFSRPCSFALHSDLCSSPGSSRDRHKGTNGLVFLSSGTSVWLVFQFLPIPSSPSATSRVFLKFFSFLLQNSYFCTNTIFGWNKLSLDYFLQADFSYQEITNIPFHWWHSWVRCKMFPKCFKNLYSFKDGKASWRLKRRYWFGLFLPSN